MSDPARWTAEEIADKRAQFERDTSPEAIASIQRYHDKVASWPIEKRCKTGGIGHLGECRFCGADQGVACRDRTPSIDRVKEMVG